MTHRNSLSSMSRTFDRFKLDQRGTSENRVLKLLNASKNLLEANHVRLFAVFSYFCIFKTFVFFRMLFRMFRHSKLRAWFRYPFSFGPSLFRCDLSLFEIVFCICLLHSFAFEIFSSFLHIQTAWNGTLIDRKVPSESLVDTDLVWNSGSKEPPEIFKRQRDFKTSEFIFVIIFMFIFLLR